MKPNRFRNLDSPTHPHQSHDPERCELCERVVDRLTVHHLVPRSQSKKKQVLPTARLCLACHRQLHVLFSNRHLARSMFSLDEIKQETSMQKFLAWVRKQDPN
ncbi:MAG: hypothetical protein JWN98_788 [Abditibacteriota bacterium]|nr:hypothetical protein [Abditibacteriota bacterium]